MALLEPKVEPLAPADTPASVDAAPDWVAAGTPEPLRGELIALLGADRVLCRASDIVRYASDASPYRLFPKAVVMARDSADVAKVLAYGRRTSTPVVFRAGGTSLSGQGQTDGILVDVRRHWRGVEVLDGGARARVKPGTVLGHVNRVLGPHGYKLGPDPASTDIACAGGVIANNSGGMRCGVARDSYRTVSAMKFVLASGTVVDSAAPDAEQRFAEAEPELAAGLLEIRDEIRADTELSDRIRRKFEIKNTTGYRLCAFLDADTPVEIMRRLIVGSEGTLAFIAEATFEAVKQPKRTTCSWLHFAGIEQATEPVNALIEAGARAVELMVAPALIVAAHSIRGAPQSWRELDPTSAALLVEFGGDDDAELDAAEARAAEVLDSHELLAAPDFHRDHETVEIYWTVREGLHGLIGKMRPPGTALIVEDVCVPPARIAEGARDLQALLGEHGFLTGVAGHASAGNLHFMLTPDFAKAADLENYDAFMEKLIALIVDRYDGSLKAEHGTGVNMAPFVAREWGEAATALMWRVKRLADPDGVLGPGIVLGDDARRAPAKPEDDAADRGGGDDVRRVRLLRAGLPEQGSDDDAAPAHRPAPRDGASGTRLAGPAQAAGGVRVRRARDLRGRRQLRACLPPGHRHRQARQGHACPAAHCARQQGRAATGRTLGDGGAGGAGRATRGRRRTAAAQSDAQCQPCGADGDLERPRPRLAREHAEAGARELPATSRSGAAAVYLPACVNRIFGRARTGGAAPSLPEAMVAVSARAGLPLWIPDDVAGHCCAMPWTSKGYAAGARRMANHTVAALWRWSDSGRLAVVCDASSCTLGLEAEAVGLLSEVNLERHGKLEILDSIAWAHQRLLARLTPRRKLASVVVHPTCASRHLDADAALGAIAATLADEVTIPVAATCCGFGGDRGLLHPELAKAATAEQAAELTGRSFDAALCSNRTCEIGLEQGTGRAYESFVFALEELTR